MRSVGTGVSVGVVLPAGVVVPSPAVGLIPGTIIGVTVGVSGGAIVTVGVGVYTTTSPGALPQEAMKRKAVRAQIETIFSFKIVVIFILLFWVNSTELPGVHFLSNFTFNHTFLPHLRQYIFS